MTIEIDFSKLSGRDVLDMAIAIEDEATIYYEQLADWVGDDKPQVVDFFKRMAVREKRHHDQIVALRDRLFADQLKQAFDVAMDAETRAHDFYAEALEYATDDKVTELFEGLRQAEADHQRMLQEEMTKFLG